MWDSITRQVAGDEPLDLARRREYGSSIANAAETNVPQALPAPRTTTHHPRRKGSVNRPLSSVTRRGLLGAGALAGAALVACAGPGGPGGAGGGTQFSPASPPTTIRFANWQAD